MWNSIVVSLSPSLSLKRRCGVGRRREVACLSPNPSAGRIKGIRHALKHHTCLWTEKLSVSKWKVRAREQLRSMGRRDGPLNGEIHKEFPEQQIPFERIRERHLEHCFFFFSFFSFSYWAGKNHLSHPRTMWHLIKAVWMRFDEHTLINCIIFRIVLSYCRLYISDLSQHELRFYLTRLDPQKNTSAFN